MAGPITITDGGFCEKDSDEVLVYQFDYDKLNLPAGVEIVTSAFFIEPDDGTLTKDNEVILPGNRKTGLRLSGGTVGARYTIINRITTNESPSQTKEKQFTQRIRT